MGGTFLRDALSMARSKGTIIFCGIVSTGLTARYLGPAGSGAYAGLLVYPGLFMSLGAMGVRQSSAYLLGRRAVDETSLRYAIFSVWLGTALLTTAISWLLIANFSSFHGPLETALAVAAIPFSLYASYISGIYLGQNRIGKLNQVDWIPAVVVLAANVVFVAVLGLGVPGALLAHLAGPLAIFVIVAVRNPVSFRGYRFEPRVMFRLLSLGAVYALSMLVINLNYRIDLILLDRLSTAVELGLYSKGAGLTQYLWQIPMLLSTIVFARSANAADDLDFSHKVARLLRVSILVIGAGCIALFVLADWIVHILFGEAFAQSAAAIRILLPGVLIMTIFKVMNMDLAGKGKPWAAMLAMLPALVINVGANILLIPRLGASGAAWSSTISYSVAGLTFAVVYARVVGLPLSEMFRFRRDDYDFILHRLKFR